MKKKWLSALSLSVALVASGCGGDDKNSTASGGENVPVPTFPADSSLDKIQKKGKLVVGVKFDQPGFGLKAPSGAIEGFDAEIAKRVAQGIFGGTVADVTPKIEFVEAISRNRELFIQNGTVDMVAATYTINDTRKNQIDFAGPYYIAGGDLLIKADNTTIKSVTDLAGKKVCTATGSTYPATLKTQVPTADVTGLGNYTDCVNALKDGRFEAVATDNVILASFSALNPGMFKLTGKLYTQEPYGIGVKKNDDLFRDLVNDRLEAIYANGQWKAAYDSTFGAIVGDAPTPPPVNRYASNGAPAVTVTTAATTTTAAGGGGATGATTTTAAGGVATTTSTTAASTTTTR